MEKMKKEIGIFILNYNGIDWLKKIVPNIIKYSDGVELVIIDNQSNDDSLIWLKNTFPDVQIRLNDKNYGFAKGYNNILLHEKKYKYFVLLNNDTQVTKNWLTPLFDLIKNENVGVVQPKIKNLTLEEKELKKSDFFDYAGAAGGFIDILGFPFCRGRILNKIEKDTGQYDNNKQIFWASGCCFIITQELFHQIHGFDEDLFMHQEEIDLCWRVQRLKKNIIYCAESNIFHFGGGTMKYDNPNKKYYNHRNSLLILSKNLPIRYLFFVIPVRLLIDYILILYYILYGVFHYIKNQDLRIMKYSFSILKAHFNYFLLLPKFIKKRNPEINSIKLVKSQLIYNNSIILDFFIRRKKKFSDLKKF